MASIASLISSGTEILFGLGVGEQVVAVSHECDFPPEVASRTRVTWSNVDSESSSDQIDEQVKKLMASGGALYDFDRAALLKLAPSVIVTQAACDVCAVRYQDVVDFVRNEPKLAETRVIALNPRSLQDVFADILRTGEALNVAPRAQEYVHQLRQRISDIQNHVTKVRRVSWPQVVCVEWIEPLMPAGNWTPELIEAAGGCSRLAEAGEHSRYASWQDVVAVDPDVLVIAPCGFDLSRTVSESTTLRSWNGYDDLKAVRNGRVFALDGNAYLNRSGPRLVDSVEILAHFLHPEMCPEVCCDAWTRLA